jgi:hypothetical protein
LGSDPSATDIYTYAVAVDTLAQVYQILDEDVVSVVTDEISDETVRAQVLGILDGSLTLTELMVATTGMYQDDEEGIVVGLPLEEEIPADSPVQTNGTLEVVDDGERTGIVFDAEEDYVIIPADPSNDLTEEGTIELWLKPATNVNWAGIIHKGTQSDWSDEGYSLQYDGSKQLALFLNSEADQSIFVRTTHVLAEGTWSHVVATWDADEVHIYVNGTDIVDRITEGFSATATTIADNHPLRSSDGDVVVGTQIPEQPYRFDGTMSDIKIYNRFMTESEVLENYGQ